MSIYTFKIYDDTDRPCPKCGGQFERKLDKHLFKCTNCGTYIDAFVLTPVQQAAVTIMKSQQYSVVFDVGGKSSGKTFKNAVFVRDTAAELNGEFEFAVGAITLKQTRLAYKELLKKIPDEWIARTERNRLDKKAPSKEEGHIRLKNGVLIRFIPTNKLGTIKSESFFLVWMIEITEGKPAFYNELLYRSRGDMDLGMHAGIDGIMIFETNSPEPDKPEQFFIIDMFWNKSHRIYWSTEKYNPPDLDLVNPEYVTFVYDALDNIENTSERFRQRAFGNKSKREVDLQRKGFVIAAGRSIYPLTPEKVVETKGYPGKVPWFASVDQGISDQLVENFFFIDPLTYQIYQFQEEIDNDMNVTTAAAKYHKVVANYGLESQYEIHDPIGCNKMFQRESDLTDIAYKWANNGIFLVRSSIFAVLPKIGMMHKLQEDDMFYFQQNCKISIQQHTNYKGVKSKTTGRVEPQKTNDHTCEANRNAISWLPIHVEADNIIDRYSEYRTMVDKFMSTRRNSGRSKVIRGTMRTTRLKAPTINKRGFRRL